LCVIPIFESFLLAHIYPVASRKQKFKNRNRRYLNFVGVG
jgi:hypothetical protein